jgi:DNA-binding transcriptional LysR family regulator
MEMAMMRLDALQMFQRVAELESFTRAADSLGVPKATLSVAIRQLEEDVGTTLLYRTTRRVSLTHDGEAFYERCRDLLSDVDEVGAMFQAAPGRETGRIRVDMPVSLAGSTIIPRLPEFMGEHPGLNIELSSTDRMVDVVREGFDCVVRVGVRTDSGLIARQLGAMAMINVASPAYLKAHGTPRNLDDLAKHRMVHYVAQLGAKPFGFEYLEGDAYRTQAVSGAVTVNNTIAFQASALAGLGIIQCPRMGAAAAIRDGRLIEVLKRYRSEPLPVAIVYPQRRHVARRVRLFIDWVATVLKPELERHAQG